MSRASLSVGDWLALGLGAAAAVLLVVAGSALAGLRGLDVELRRMEVAEPRAEAAAELQIAVFRLGSTARAVALAPTGARRDALATAELEVDALLGRLGPHVDEPGDADAFRPVPLLVAQYRARAHELATTTTPAQVAAAEARLLEVWEALVPPLDAYAELQRGQLSATAADLLRRRERADALLVAGIAVALALLALVAVLIGRAVRRPIRDLVALTREVAAGDFSGAAALAAPVPGRAPRNELVELAAAFGAMARTLEEREQELHERNEDLRGQNEALRASEDALREADRRKDEFLAVLSHELRNPLAPIVNGLAILGRAEPGGAQAERARKVLVRQVRQLVRLVDDLLDATRIARGKITLRRAETDVCEILRHVAEDHRALFEHGDVRLELVLPADPIVAWADGERLAQVVANLLQNAAKFTPPGGTVSASCEAAGGRARLSIRDDGEGIPPELLPHVFEPFVQAEASLARTRGGLGLGLALVKGLVELHGGTVVAASGGPGRGSEFTVELPVAPAEQVAPASVAAAG